MCMLLVRNLDCLYTHLMSLPYQPSTFEMVKRFEMIPRPQSITSESNKQGRIQDFWEGDSYIKVFIYKGFADFISCFLKYPVKMK